MKFAGRRAPELLHRTEELAELAGLLADRRVRLLSLSGTAGVGKSSLARAALRAGALHEYRVVSVDLASAADRPVALACVLDQLCGPGPDRPGEPAELLRSIAAALATDPAVLLLDNCDPVAAAISCDIAQLLDRSPRLRIVLTTRVPLGLRNECVLSVSALPAGAPTEHGDFSPAAQLLLSSIDRDCVETAARAEQAVLEDISRAVGGVPLALELAAADIVRVGAAETLRRIEAGGDLVTARSADTPVRHRSLCAAIDWGLTDVDPVLLELLLRLAQCTDAVDRGAVLLLGGLDGELTTTGLAELVNRSLLHGRLDAQGEVSYELTATVRIWCRRRLAADPGLAARLRAEHLDRLCRLAEFLGRGMDPARPVPACADVHAGDFRTAISELCLAGRVGEALRIAADLQDVWIRCGHLDDVERRLSAGLAQDLPGAERLRGVRLLGRWALAAGRFRRAVALLDEAAALRRFGEQSDTDADPLELARAALTPLAPVSAEWAELRQRIQRIAPADGGLAVRNALASNRLCTADRALLIYREVLEHPQVHGYPLEAICAIEGCGAAYALCGAEYAAAGATLALAGARLRADHGIPALDTDGEIFDWPQRLGRRLFADTVRLVSTMSLAAAIDYARSVRSGHGRSALDTLTPRQREIAELVATGKTNRMIAGELGLSEWTVVNHLRRVMVKLGCPSRLHIALLVQRGAKTATIIGPGKWIGENP
ncbi:LuxR C-terminal-related transcriptional regulator [Nocardia brasiliensis]|uniref:LuxR C-terminal-related transcriptional regulator n=1 Tax=Nocardia brasiliensis TaxID=37326 RepID=UPI0004A6B602|nr:LuxR C-terminal-related transcriptional regulator [Nocardia brasiliensis]